MRRVRSHAGAVRRAGGDPRTSGNRCDAVVGADRVRPLDARQRFGTARGAQAREPLFLPGGQADQALEAHRRGQRAGQARGSRRAARARTHRRAAAAGRPHQADRALDPIGRSQQRSLARAAPSRRLINS